MVRDTDGSAFITKAEFDSLKNNFQSQIDSYNLSIDNKIDGATATYLSGIKVSSRKNVANIGYSDDGVVNIEESQMDWIEGTMGTQLRSENIRWGTSRIGSIECSGVLVLDFLKNPESFYENIIEKENFDDNAALWSGYMKVNDNLHFEVFSNNESSWNYRYNNKKVYVGMKGWWSFFSGVEDIRNTPNEFTERDGWNTGLDPSVVKVGFTDSNTETNYLNSEDFKGANLRIYDMQREVKEIVYDCGIITIKNQQAKRLNNIDPYHDFFNDADHDAEYPSDTNTGRVRYHTNTTNYMTDLFDSVGNSVFNGITYNAGHLWESGDIVLKNILWTNYSPSGSFKTIKPYFGFDQYVRYWNDLYTSKYDNNIKIINKQLSPSRLQNTKIINGVEHLALDAGLPVCELNKDETITIPLEFEDKTKDYDVWIRLCDFSHNTDPWDEVGNYQIVSREIEFSTHLSDTHTIAGDPNGIICIDGQDKISFTAPVKGCVFIKFAEHGTGGKGFAKLITPEYLEVSSPS